LRPVHFWLRLRVINPVHEFSVRRRTILPLPCPAVGPAKADGGEGQGEVMHCTAIHITSAFSTNFSSSVSTRRLCSDSDTGLKGPYPCPSASIRGSVPFWLRLRRAVKSVVLLPAPIPVARAPLVSRPVLIP
jgi:hypothetical protein